MRVLFVTKPHFRRIGGAQLTTDALAAGLCRRGHEVMLLAARDDPSVAGPEVPGLDPGTRAYAVRESRDTAAAMPDALEEMTPDVVVVDDRGPLALVTRQVLRAARDFPTIMHLHGLGSQDVVANADARPDLVVAVSAYLARVVLAGGLTDVAVVPPAIDPEPLAPPATRRVALLTSMARHKGFDTAVALARARPDVRFAFVLTSHPAEREHVAGAAERMALLPNVELRRESTDPREVYRDARVVLIPSIQPEGFGRVAAEADMCGIPVVAARVGGLEEAVGSGARFVDPSSGPAAWERALAAVWDDPREYARRARPAGRPELHPDAAAAAWERHLSAVVVQRAAA